MYVAVDDGEDEVFHRLETKLIGRSVDLSAF